jgi:hypothetical protein
MSTRGNLEQSSVQSQASQASKHAVWSAEEEQALVSALLEHKAQAGE